jgi:ribosomal protein L31
MRKGIHPLQRALTIINTKGASTTVWSVARPPNGHYQLQSDTTTHPAWTGRRKEVAATGRVAQFKQRFAANLLSAASKQAPGRAGDAAGSGSWTKGADAPTKQR